MEVYMNETVFSILLVLVGIFLGIIIFIIINYIRGIRVNQKADNMLEKAKKEADKIKRDYILEAKEEAQKIKIDTDKEIKEKKAELKESEERLLTREGNMDRRDQTLQNREQMLEERENNIINKQRDLEHEQEKVEEIKKEQIQLLEKIAGYSKEEARELVMKRVEEMMSLEIASYIKDKESEAKLEVDKKAKSLLVSSMQKYASDVSNEQTVTVVALPNDDMKGRIIGREGRNIRTIESVTGVDLIIDDTPEAIVVSSFDPLRREIARITIETLVKDGRIHPARIEEVYDKTVKEMHNKIIELGNEALFELGITKMDPELIELLGKLHFRTSYGQNVLRHSVEVAQLAGIMAAELGENVTLAKRAGILHDIGKAIDHEVEGSHVDLGSEIASKYKENKVVINAIESHHGNKEATSVISELVAIADALSASRPGARNDSLENYVKRLQDLEAIGKDINGVQSTYAIQAGRELRVIVKPEEIDDLGSFKVARDIKEKIESELQYPGTIKVVVIRETRATEEAK
ncbi:MAG: ribonuclease Y [Bacilli bacterium]|nr:ribonuclease Y [Bacilli bacterium]